MFQRHQQRLTDGLQFRHTKGGKQRQRSEVHLINCVCLPADRKSLRTGCPHPQGCQPHRVLSLPAAQQQWRHGCMAVEMEAQRVSSLRLLEFLFSAEIHQDLSSLLYFSTPSCDVNTYAGIHLHFKRTSSHGVRATGCFSRCCRPRWLSLRKKNRGCIL